MEQKSTRRFSHPQQLGHETPRRLSQEARQPSTIRFISSTVHIIFDSDSKQARNQNISKKVANTYNYFSCGSEMNNVRQSDLTVCENTADYDNDFIAVSSEPHADDNNNKRDRNNPKSTFLMGTSDNERRSNDHRTSDNHGTLDNSRTPDNHREVADIASSPSQRFVSNTRPRLVRCDGLPRPTDNDTDRDTVASSILRRPMVLPESQGHDPTFSQWTTCRALLDNDDDDADNEQQLEELENMSVSSNLYFTDDDTARSLSRASSMSSLIRAPARGTNNTGDDSGFHCSSPIWVHEQAAGRLSRMTSISTLLGGGAGGRKKRPLLLPPIMLPPIFAAKPTPLVLRDDVHFASSSGASRCRPVSDEDWDRLWDCRYLRIPNRSPKRAVRV